MNKSRRKEIDALIVRLEEAAIEARSLIEAVDAVKDAEQEALDNLPESLRDGERGCAMQGAVDSLEAAIDHMGDIPDALDAAYHELNEALK